ncbi:hypothetical protein QIS74_07017 [Colletotrichum tabaci]|uniref:Cytochrome P450 n=1 Tax=Colletotrichum tabaci TaxID=1209068 RepID=A0AAV9TAU6_9PEZI
MHDETRCCVDELWGLDSDEWKEIDAMTTVQHMIAQVVGRVFFGAPLCRNKRLQDLSLAFTQDVPLSAMIHLAQIYGILKTELARRLSLYDLRQKDHEPNLEEPDDFLQWSIQQAKMLDDPQHSQPYALARRLMIVNFSSIHTSSLVIMNALGDITKNPEHIDELRREITEVLAHHGGCWSKSAVADMIKLDSAMRESQRLNNGNFITVVRKVVQPDGITTPTGFHLPYGTILGVPGYGVHHDEDIYPNPNDYRPFRFSEIRTTQTIPVNEEGDGHAQLRSLGWDGARDTSFLAAIDPYSQELRAVPGLENCLGDHVVQLAGVANVAEEMVTEAEAEVEAVAQIRRENPLCGDRGFKPRDLAEAYNEPEHWGGHDPGGEDGARTAHRVT